MLKDYYQLTKPGIIYGNLLTAAAGFIFGSEGIIAVWAFLLTLAGVAGVIASACVANNILDRDIDAHMQRTKDRALVRGAVRPQRAATFSFFLAWIGFGLLWLATNPLTVAIGVVGWLSYVVVYTYAKRKTHYSTLIGTIPGATSIVAGYTAAFGHFNVTALILATIMVVWQLPHFYAIAIFRERDYSEARLPVLPIVKGVPATKAQIVLWVAVFIPVVLALSLSGRAGYAYAVVMLVVSATWLVLAVRDRNTSDSTAWARRVFRTSLIVLLTLSCMLAANSSII